MINATGLDGCKSGWLLIYYQDYKYKHQLIASIHQAVSIFEQSRKIFIDIPIGLSSKNYNRQIEKKMRHLLKNRSSTVFTPPCREAVKQENYQLANKVNRAVTSKGLSKQAFNIGKKIAEVDHFLEQERKYQLVESHPEICFKLLNRSVLQTKKNTNDGQMERRNLISSFAPRLDKLVEDLLTLYPKSKVQPDDIIDAAVLCLSAQISLTFNTLLWKEANYTDEMGIQVKIEAGEMS